jgi:hypothetical protein
MIRIKNRLSYAWMAAAGTCAIATGLAYGFFHYFCQTEDPYSVVNHPLEPLARTLHIVTTPLLTLMLGLFWIKHAWPYLQRNKQEGKRSGLILCLTALPMIFSGYLLQVSVSPGWKTCWVWVHNSTSLVWLAGLLAHLYSHMQHRKRHQNIREV